MAKIYITSEAVAKRAKELVSKAVHLNPSLTSASPVKLYGVPRGGVPAAYALSAAFIAYGFKVVFTEPEQADFIVDDLVDSGLTEAKFTTKYKNPQFVALFRKSEFGEDNWLVFPWESDGQTCEDDSIIGTLRNRRGKNAANENVAAVFASDEERKQHEQEVTKRCQNLLDSLLITTEHDHNTRETAARMGKLFCREIFAGRFNFPPTLTLFPNVANKEHQPQLVITPRCTVRSMCSHHLAPITGHAVIGFVAGQHLLGLSKFNRVVEWFASRPQIQEEMTDQIADYLYEQLAPRSLLVRVVASHACMTLRGVKEDCNGKMDTLAVRGTVSDSMKAEFLQRS